MRALLPLAALLVAACQTVTPSGVDPAPSSAMREGVASRSPAVAIVDVGDFAGMVPNVDRRDALVRQFEATVFHDESSRDIPYVRKWSGPIRYRIRSSHKIAPMVSDAAKRLERLVGLRIIESWKQPNVDFITRPGKNRDDHCHAIAYSKEDDGTAVAAEVFIGPTISEDFLSECVTEEFSQLLGPFNDATVIEDTLWRPFEKKTYHDLTWSDAVILRTLYDERIKPGMHRDKALPIARQIIGELLAELNR